MRLKAILSIVATCAMTGQAEPFSVTVLFDSFDTRPDGALAADGGWSTLNPTTLNTKRRLEVLPDTGNLFGNGTANKILYFQNIAGNPNAYKTILSADSLTSSTMLMVSFDFYEPSTTTGGISIYVGSDPSATSPANAFSLTDGAVGPSGSYTLDAPHHLDVVFNESGSVLEYDDPAGGTSSLDTGLMDIWIDSVRVAAGVTQSRAATPLPELASVFLTSDGVNQNIYLDNVEFLQPAGVPPSPPSINFFTADPSEVNPGDSVTLSWSTTYAESLSIDQDIGDVTGMGSTSITVLASTVYSLIAMNSSGSATSTVSVALLPPSLAITNFVVGSGTATVEWNQSSDHYIVVSGNDLPSFPAAGTVEVSETGSSNSTAVFAHDSGQGFFQVMLNIATNGSVTNPVLRSEVEVQASAHAPTNRIYDIDLAGITGMTLPGQEVAITELGEFANLDKLSLAGSGLTALGDLSPLSGLTWLNLSSNELVSVTSLAVLDNLEALNLEKNQIADLSGIESLTHLRWLDLEDNQVADLSLVVSNAVSGGLGEGDELWVRGNPLGAAATNQIQMLEANYNVRVVY